MDKPYQELAKLVGKVLAKRWLSKGKERSPQNENQSDQQEAAYIETELNDVVDTSGNA